MKTLCLTLSFFIFASNVCATECNSKAIIESEIKALSLQEITAEVFFDKIKQAGKFVHTGLIESGNSHQYIYDVIMSDGPTRVVKKTHNYGYTLKTKTTAMQVDSVLDCAYRDAYFPNVFGRFDTNYVNKISINFFVGNLIDLTTADITSGMTVNMFINTNGDLSTGRENEFVLSSKGRIFSQEERREILWSWEQRIQKPRYEYQQEDGCEIKRTYYQHENVIAERMFKICEKKGDNQGINTDSAYLEIYTVL